MPETDSINLDIEGLENAQIIGAGGFATVYKASQPAFGRTVAVKLLATMSLDEESRERFERECQAMGALSEHPNIVTVYGAGFNPQGRPYLLMAYLSGGSLQERIDAEQGLSWEEATLYGVHLAGALETAHRANIVHRDIKPGNVLMSSFGDAELTDFGIARISGGHETRGSMVSASFAHAPPEVLDGKKPAVSGDVYSLGSTIFELISGKPAFSSDDDESLVPMLRRVLSDPPPDLRLLGVPDEIAAVIEKSMEKRPEDRQASAVEFGRALQDARRELGLDPGRLTVPSEVARPEDQTARVDMKAAARATAMMERPGPQAKKGSRVAIGVAIGALILVLAGAVAVLATRSSSSTGSATTTQAPPVTDPPVTLPTDFTPASHSAFVDACVKSEAEKNGGEAGANRKPLCECVFTEITRNFTFEQWLKIQDEAEATKTVGAKIQPLVDRCLKDNPPPETTTTTAATVAPDPAATPAP